METIGQILLLLGVPGAITSLCFWRLQVMLTKRDNERAKQEAEKEKKAEEREKNREELDKMLLQSSSAAIALGEATARAVQRIPDANCNGDMHAALAYAEKVKHAQKDFVYGLGIHALHDE